MHVATGHQIQQTSALPASATRAETGARPDDAGLNGGTASALGVDSPQEEFCLQGDATKARRCVKACKQCDACHQKQKCTNPKLR